MLRSTSARAFAIISLAAVLAACSDSNDPDPGTAPTLPALQSMQADLSLFAASGSVEPPVAAAAGTNFLAGALSVSVANFWTTVVMAVPVATWAAAASDTPEFSDGAFHWEYAVTEGGNSFAADLSGRGEGSESVWEMRVSASATNPPLDNFLWYTGRAALTGTDGEWHIFDAGQPSSQDEVLRIDWSHPSSNAWTLTFTNVHTGAIDVGDMLEYEVTGDERLVRFTDVSASTTVEIGWNATTQAGYVQAPNFNGGARACWSATLDNVACP